MKNFRHLFPKSTAKIEKYISPNLGRDNFDTPLRSTPQIHGQKLIEDIEKAKSDSDYEKSQAREKGIVLEFTSDPKFDLYLRSLEARASKIELLSSKNQGDVMKATVFIPYEKIGLFIKKFKSYCTEINRRSGQPKNRKLVESISSICLATLESLWTDSLPIPNPEENCWFEIWLRDVSKEGIKNFIRRAKQPGIIVRDRILYFPERSVIVLSGTLNKLLDIPGLFDFITEIKMAKALSGDYLSLGPTSQLEYVESLLKKVEGNPHEGPSICHLDTGTNIVHPLLGLAISEEHVLAVDPTWTTTDIRGHGTEMAGLALWGCLTEALNGDDVIRLNHCLESIKLLPDKGANDPDLYGEITSQAVSRIKIAASTRKARVFCLAITSDSRDGCYPSSWSAAIDQLTSARDDSSYESQLFVVSAGNVGIDHQHGYPEKNYEESVEDPAQSWNAVTVGAYTKRNLIEEVGYDDWRPIAESDCLSPSSRTSICWPDKSWPIKPDIVMEGGNSAIDPSTKKADSVDDLSLLTTKVSLTGAQFTTTGDTSASAALASRFAAMVWSSYPTLWAETIRGLLIHSARWTDSMMREFPYPKRHDRLRVYGYGVPDIRKAISSANREATQIIETELRPFELVRSKCKTKEMHIHSLPWPKEVLESLGEAKVTMRVTLSYFIEPSPNGRGWTRGNRYQSCGLRFEVKRPLEMVSDFSSRISAALREEDENYGVSGSDERSWALGSNLRRKGSIHSDSWTGSAVDLANCGMLAVFPVTGWWKERYHLLGWMKSIRYSLIVTLETSVETDLYTPIANKIGVPIEIAV
ncbi:MAG TPA: S8 family peptidase [Oligoflexia bacterium]|nr:S8 family peptidase [Oligoflexia bacterium]HMP49112.1 S8 family peptidase [Oligoflexia bacterium]